MLDVLTGIALVVAAASIWRAIYRLEDEWFFPNDVPTSAMASLGLGIGILLVRGKDVLEAVAQT